MPAGVCVQLKCDGIMGIVHCTVFMNLTASILVKFLSHTHMSMSIHEVKINVPCSEYLPFNFEILGSLILHNFSAVYCKPFAKSDEIWLDLVFHNFLIVASQDALDD